jgi:fructose-1,6-bisphosphatase II
MRILLNQTEINGQIVIGEGEIDDAPMLYIGETVGLGGEVSAFRIPPPRRRMFPLLVDCSPLIVDC